MTGPVRTEVRRATVGTSPAELAAWTPLGYVSDIQFSADDCEVPGVTALQSSGGMEAALHDYEPGGLPCVPEGLGTPSLPSVEVVLPLRFFRQLSPLSASCRGTALLIEDYYGLPTVDELTKSKE
ncbi:hypothetical protein ACIBAC_00070 [Streptomyces sp. NPDC051362]|uniref:hypothetical protein n=1 Tax=Streptomyces sp. NPDC051362 TaxID=3365651 RepID=UPI0037A67620